MVKLGQGGSYLKSSEVNSGDIITFKNEGGWETSTKYRYKNEDGSDGEFKKSFVVKVAHKDNEVLMRVNKSSRDAMVALYGDDTSQWVGKQAKIIKEHSRQINADVLYLEGVEGVEVVAKAKEVSPDWED